MPVLNLWLGELRGDDGRDQSAQTIYSMRDRHARCSIRQAGYKAVDLSILQAKTKAVDTKSDNKERKWRCARKNGGSTRLRPDVKLEPLSKWCFACIARAYVYESSQR